MCRVESLACHPATTTHSELSLEERQAAGLGDGLVRVSIGIVDRRDLLEDLTQALDAAHAMPEDTGLERSEPDDAFHGTRTVERSAA